ncbi:MAG: hypothetical protein F8N37_08905 [Telmatospirillum sp.]|nr:hypothetical protein [Telmatospirillum sp.]
MDSPAMLKRLAADLVEGRSLRPSDGAPWDDLAGELERLDAQGCTLAELAAAVRADLTDAFPE